MIYAKELFSCILAMDDFGGEQEGEDNGEKKGKENNYISTDEGIKKTGLLLCTLMKE